MHLRGQILGHLPRNYAPGGELDMNFQPEMDQYEPDSAMTKRQTIMFEKIMKVILY